MAEATGHVGHVVDVEAHHLALGLHDADHAEAGAGDADELAEGASLAEELARELRAEHGEGSAAPRVALRPEGALPGAEAPEGREVGGGPEHGHAAAALAGLDAGEAHRDRHHGLDAGDAGERLGVVDGELARGAAEDARDADRLRLAGVDGQDVRPELGELRHHVDARALADRGEQDDRGHADRDPEHREEGPQAVGAQGALGEVQQVAHRLPPRERRHGVEPGGPARGQDAEDGAHRDRERERGDDRPGRGRRRERRVDGHEQPAPRASRRGGREAPPAVERSTASARKASRICRRPAPRAFSRPISRVRSETETSITFMMPTPATASDTLAMPARARVRAPRMEREGAEHRVLGDAR